MADLKTSIIIDLAGNLTQRAHRYTNSLRKFSTTGQRHLSGLGRVAKLTGQNIERMGNRWTGLATGAGATFATRFVLGLEKRLERLGIQANITDKKISDLKKKIFDKALKFKIDPSELIAAGEEIVKRRGDMELFIENMDNIGIAMQGTGAAGMDIGSMIANLDGQFRLKGKDEFLATLDELARQGDEGAFELRDLVTEGGRVSAMYASTGRTGRLAAREMGALLQIIIRATDTAPMAATAFERIITTLTSEKVELLQKNGIKIWDAEELKKGNKIARSVPEIIKEIIIKTKGDQELLGKIFDDRALRGINAFANEFKATGGFPSLDKFLAIKGDGTVISEKAIRGADNASDAFGNLLTVLKRYVDDQLTRPIQAIAEAINKLEPETINKIATSLIAVGTLAGVFAIGAKLKRGIGSIGKTYKGSPGKTESGIPGLAAGVQPVYVVNFPGVPGLGGLAGSSKGKTAAKALTAGAVLKGGALIGGAGLAGFGVGTLVDKGLQQFEAGNNFRHEIGATIATLLAGLGNENAKNAVEQELKSKAEVGGTLNIKIDSEGRPSVTKLEKTGGMDIDVDAGLMMVTQ